MAVIRATFTTMGQSSPASLGLGKPYRYNGDKPHVPPAPAEVRPADATRMRTRAERIAEYGRLQTEEGLSPEEAAERVGAFGRTTRRVYELAFQEQQQRGGTP